MENNEEVCDQSRRKLLKKTYAAPVVIALGSMSFTTEANAKRWGHHGGSSSNGGSSLSGGSKCNRCHHWPCRCR